MNDFSSLGRWIIGAGLVIVMVGVLVSIAAKIPGLGRLPGDILIRREHTTFYFPLMTSLVLSVIVSLVMHFMGRK